MQSAVMELDLAAEAGRAARALENREYVRWLLARREPGFAELLESAPPALLWLLRRRVRLAWK